jgi:hypothetical protein
MEVSMSARTTRQEARERAMKVFTDSLDRIIPADESVPLKGSRFRDWEDQVEELVRQTAPTVLQERAALEDNARAEGGGRCPHCGSDRVYLEKRESQPEVVSPHGPVVVSKQHCRCRACGGSFSPSGS